VQVDFRGLSGKSKPTRSSYNGTPRFRWARPAKNQESLVHTDNRRRLGASTRVPPGSAGSSIRVSVPRMDDGLRRRCLQTRRILCVSR